MIMEGLSSKDCGVQFYVACFYVWDAERQVLRHEPSGPGLVVFSRPPAGEQGRL
jgi:hypothetical protein